MAEHMEAELNEFFKMHVVLLPTWRQISCV
jgi:hypothetical protein